MPQVEIPIDEEQQSGENCSLASPAETVASQSLSSDGSRPSSGAPLQPSFASHFNRLATLAIPSRPFQRQTNLIDALKLAAGTNEMALLTQIHLHLASSMFGVHRLNVFLPSLTALNLDGSALDSLRDLGSELTINFLNVSRCGLRNLDGINGMQMVEHLIADNNKIECLLPLTTLCELQTLSLNGNFIETPEALRCLALCARLVELSLRDNPVTKSSDYRRSVNQIIPNLLILDGMSVDTKQSKPAVKVSSSEFSSSLSSSLSRDIDNANPSITNGMQNSRPLSATPNSSFDRNAEITLNIRNRPSTAEPFGHTNRSICRGDPIVGNIIEKVRRERRNQPKATASHSQSSAASSLSRAISSCSNSNSSSSSTDVSNDRRFPSVLPQSIVELELGIIEIQKRQPSPLPLLANRSFSASYAFSNDLHLQNGDETTGKLLAAARKWREASQRSRSSGVHNTK